MARKDVNFIDKHVEKILLGTCAAVLIGAAWYSFSGTRFAVAERSPAELAKSLDEAAEQTRQSVMSARYTPPRKETTNPQDDPVAQLKEWYGDGAKGLIKMAPLPELSTRVQAFPPLMISVMKTSPEDRRDLVKLLPPGPPVITTGRSTFVLFREPFEITGYDPRNGWFGMEDTKFEASKTWVAVASQVDLTKQKAKFIEQGYPASANLPIVRVHLQRKDVADSGKNWEDIDSFVPYAPLKRPVPAFQGDGRVRFDNLDSFRNVIQQTSALIINPPLPTRLAGDKPELPALPYLDEPPSQRNTSPEDANRRVKKWTDLGNAALLGKRPFKEPDINAAIILAKAAVGTAGARDKELEAAKKLLAKVIEKAPKNLKTEAKAAPQTPETLMPILGYDLSPQPGHTYVYRMRYEMLNPFAGNSAELKNPTDAAKLTVFSDWSSESRPVEITSDIYFYLTKADKAKKEVVVTVFKVTKRATQKQEFRISAGEEIGKKDKKKPGADFSTGAVCVDIDFDREIDGKKEIALIYAQDGNLRQKVLSRDLKDKVFRRLNEIKTAQP